MFDSRQPKGGKPSHRIVVSGERRPFIRENFRNIVFIPALIRVPRQRGLEQAVRMGAQLVVEMMGKGHEEDLPLLDLFDPF